MNLNAAFGNLTGSVRGIWGELVERRLWPLAIALVVALVALPVVLAKPASKTPSAAPAPAPSGGAASPLAAFQPAVSTEGRKSSEIRKDLRRFKAKNPFTPQGLNLGSSTSSALGNATPTVPGATGTSATPTGDTGLNPGTSTPSPSPAPTPTAPSTSGTVRYFTYTADVRFGKTGNTDVKTLTQFRALPSSEDPLVVFMGVRPDGETAAFLISSDVTSKGDGKCKPSAELCTFLYMKKGDTQTFEAVGADGSVVDYELKLRDIDVKVTNGPTNASSSSASSASSARARAAARHVRRHSLTRAVRSFERLGF
jgi:hypothetical protein